MVYVRCFETCILTIGTRGVMDWEGDDRLDWWPPHVQALFAAVGRAMGRGRLHPDTLEALPNGFGAILPGHQVEIVHVAAREFGRRRKGQYRIIVRGPVLGGGWHFSSGKLERLSRLAAQEATGPR